MCYIDIKDVKLNIENNTLTNNIIIFVGNTSNQEFIFNQYLHEFSNVNKYDIINIESISDIPAKSIFDNENSNIVYKLNVEKLAEFPTDTIEKIWVYTKSVSKDIVNSYSVVKLPKLEKWHIVDYIHTTCPTLSTEEIEKLTSVYKTLYRVDLELDKLKLVPNYGYIENQLFVDTTDITIFDIVNCIIQRDKAKLHTLKTDMQYVDIDSFGLIKLLSDNFRYVIDIQLARNSTPEYVGVSEKRFWAIKKYSCNHYTKEELIKIYKFICSIDSSVKSGKLPANIAVDYIITKIMLI